MYVYMYVDEDRCCRHMKIKGYRTPKIECYMLPKAECRRFSKTRKQSEVRRPSKFDRYRPKLNLQGFNDIDL